MIGFLAKDILHVLDFGLPELVSSPKVAAVIIDNELSRLTIYFCDHIVGLHYSTSGSLVTVAATPIRTTCPWLIVTELHAVGILVEVGILPSDGSLRSSASSSCVFLILIEGPVLHVLTTLLHWFALVGRSCAYSAWRRLSIIIVDCFGNWLHFYFFRII